MASLYLHIPFCEHKCIYCDFYSVAPTETGGNYESLTGRFLSALRKEIDVRSADARFQVVYDTVFFGGGTPSLLSPSNIGEILETLNRNFSIRKNAEITLETNPGTVDLRKLSEFRQVGVNRISFGVQSFYEDDLRFLTRIHTSKEAVENVRNAYHAGFDNVSIDLIFSLPGQNIERWASNLRQAVALEPAHLSCYSLIVEPNTQLHRMVQAKQVSTLPAEEDANLYEFTMEYLSAQGFEQYEVSNFAKFGYRSRHNSNYWNHSNYLGFGPSAHSFWSHDEAVGCSSRWWNIANVVEYAHRLGHGHMPVQGEEQLSGQQLMEEEIFLGLRSDGIDVAGFRKKYAWDFLVHHSSTIKGLLEDNLASLSGQRLRLTSKGYLLCDEICRSFLT
ncbi:MAG: radical SAM family heme chaperone HemW [Ignavibacteriales bacterium]|nr:radical SAM family heme chaperone HemW [Ignavibacteriales bacterium]